MPVLPQDILSQLVAVPHRTRLQQAYLAAVDLTEEERNRGVPWANGGEFTSIAFQYWPESISDTRASEWNPRNIPGGSHPLYQWTHGGERLLSFTAQFTTDTEPEEAALVQDDPYLAPVLGQQVGDRDIDLRAVKSWLRYFTYPSYGQGEDLRVFEPPKCLLVMPNTGLGYNGDDAVLCVMTQCDFTYEAWFPSGFPRIIEAQLAFAEVVQQRSGVRFHDRRDMRRAASMSRYGRVRV